jgi:hypothetical protein
MADRLVTKEELAALIARINAAPELRTRAHDFGTGSHFNIYTDGWTEFPAGKGADKAPAWNYPSMADAATSDRKPVIGPDDAPHKAARDVIDHIASGQIVKPVREAIRKALDQADAPPTGKAADGSHRPPQSKAFRLDQHGAKVGFYVP